MCLRTRDQTREEKTRIGKKEKMAAGHTKKNLTLIEVRITKSWKLIETL